MTHAASLTPRARPHPGIIATALTVLAYSDPPTAVDEPKAIDDGAVVLADKKVYNGVVVLVDDMAGTRYTEGGNFSGGTLTIDGNKAGTQTFNKGLGNGVAISHHREPHLVAGIVHRRGVHLALDD